MRHGFHLFVHDFDFGMFLKASGPLQHLINEF